MSDPQSSDQPSSPRGKRFLTADADMLQAVGSFWTVYYKRMLGLHKERGRRREEPIKDRNLGTTAAEHVTILEQFWGKQLATTIGVDPSQVGKRRVKLAPHKSKSFDVCWPLEGEPKILLSVKSMQNAYRNLTNRIEEACGDSAVLRLYRSPAVFGFFFFVLNGNVPRGHAVQGATPEGKKGKGVPPFLDLIEEGGDFFDLRDIDRYRKPPKPPPKRPRPKQANGPQLPPKQDAISVTEMILLDLAAERPSKKAHFLYDAIAFVPTRIKNVASSPGERTWQYTISPVNVRLAFSTFLATVTEVATLRGFLQNASSK